MRASRLILLLGSSLVLLGGLVIFGWLSHQPALIHLAPGFEGMPYSTAIGLVLSGFALLSAKKQCFNDAGYAIGVDNHPPTARNTVLSRVLAILLVLLGIVALIEWQTGVALGLRPDFQALRQWLVDTNPYSGRMRPLAAIAFIATGLVVFWLPRAGVPRIVVTIHSLILLIGLIGFLGVLGQLAGFSKVFTWYLGPVLTAGAGFMLCSLGLFVLLHHHPAYQTSWGSEHGEKISLVMGAIIVVTGLGGIFGGFAVLYPEAVGQLEINLALSLQSRSDTLQSAIQQGWLDSHSFGNQPLRLEAMRRLNRKPQSPQQQANLSAVAERYRAFGFSAVVFRNAAGREIARAGAFIRDPDLRVTVQTQSPSELLWKQGFVLHTRIDMTDQDTVVGTLEAERPLPVDDRLHDTAHFGATLDFGVCAPVGGKANCFPFRSSNWKILRDVPLQLNGQPLPISYALAGKTGVIQTMDYRGVQVIAAYAPLGSLGLGAVLKIDAAELYRPIAQRLSSLLAMFVLIAVASIALLNLQVMPLVKKMIQEIQERKKAEARLQDSEAKLAEITATLGEGVYVLDEEGLVTFINPEAERLLGWTAAELMGQDAHCIFHFKKPDGSVIPTSDCLAHRAIRTGQDYRGLSDWFVRKDGTFLPVSIAARPIIRNGAIKGSVTSFEDITPRLAAEKALRESEERFRTTLENAPIGMGIVSSDGHFLKVNHALCTMFGYTQAELENLELRFITHPDDREKSDSLWQRTLKSELDDYRIEKRYLRKDGEIIWGQLTASVIKDASGTPLYVIGQIEDISARKRNEELLKESEERFRLISTAATDGIVTIGPEGEIDYLNPAAERIFGYRASEVIGQPFHELLVPSRFLGDFYRGFERFRVSGAGPILGKILEMSAVRKSGEEFPVELSISALHIQDTWHAVGLIRYISERKRTEEQIRHLAYYDFLTDLPNRRLFFDRLNQALIQAQRHKRLVAVLYLDLDRFKEINDSLGHDVGDELLVTVATRLRNCVRGSDTVCRMGGDEFAIVLAEMAHPQDAATVADKIIESIKEPVCTKGHDLTVSTSIGIAVYSADGMEDAQALIKKADIALYDAKGAGRDQYKLFCEASRPGPA